MSVFVKKAPAPSVKWGSAKAKSNVVSHGKMNTKQNMETKSYSGMPGAGAKKSGCSSCGGGR